MTSSGSQSSSALLEDARAVATTLMPIRREATRKTSLIVTRSSSVKRSRLSMKMVAERVLAASGDDQRKIPIIWLQAGDGLLRQVRGGRARCAVGAHDDERVVSRVATSFEPIESVPLGRGNLEDDARTMRAIGPRQRGLA